MNLFYKKNIILLLILLFNCYPEYRVPYLSGIIDVKHTSRGENNFFYPSRNDQITNVVGSGKLLKQGKSCSISVFFVEPYVFVKGGSIRSAAASADISKIGSVEYSLFSFFGLYINECIIVWGE
ncbi:MAG TPA: TRL domain-containing protein [Leptospiraceae bacterium]|nr:TRL domain-containing protein [Leptospiraceae bacterium]HMY65452.1 TRL domain-containing protein [Leptospiraceae bacterium]HMZ57710.1 TRL domain-containing protein [Leptospiraceae bacterium]HNF14308.1 TRL domain-containing protein [Leptospiraceae bacterium]HNF23548.1 TRL domain-containing protein [Leptospiraceae bacterium]